MTETVITTVQGDPIVYQRFRPRQYANCFRLTLERGDGECIDLGDLPTLGDPISVSRFLVRLSDAVDRCGRYDHSGSMDWSPKGLDFCITDKPAK